MVRLIVHNLPTEILLQTVAISSNKLNSDDVILFRCYHCGTGISKVKGKVNKISAGIVPNSDVTVIQQCHICKENYTFQTVKGTKNDTNLILSPEKDKTVSTFHCIICRTPIFQYNDEIAVTVLNVAVVPLLSRIKCTEKACKKAYLLDEIVSLVV